MVSHVHLGVNRWADEEFHAMRSQVLGTWPAAGNVSLDEAIAYLKTLPQHQNQPRVLQQALAQGRTVIQAGISDVSVDESIERLLVLQNEGQADVLAINLDSCSRANHYAIAERCIEESCEARDDHLDGFPVVNHGVRECRLLRRAVDRPLVVRSASADSRLATEIAWASGFSDAPCGGVIMPASHHTKIALADSIRNWQYVARLGAWYTEHGWPVNHEIYGGLAGKPVPPSICLSFVIIDGLIQAAQGIKFLSAGYAPGGNLIQDVAGVRVLKRLAHEYMARFGLEDVTVSTTFYQLTTAAASDSARSYALLCWTSMAAVLAGVTQLIVKCVGTPPTAEAVAQASRATKAVITMLCNQTLPDSADLAEEMHCIEIETRAIVDAVIEMGSGDVVVGATRAVESGVLDCPFSPWQSMANKVVPARDAKGAIRFRKHGGLPLPAEAVELHQRHLEMRCPPAEQPLAGDFALAGVFPVLKDRV